MTAGGFGAADPDAARRVAKDILSDRRFHPRQGPKPFAGFFGRVGELVVDPVLRFFRAIGDALPRVGSPLWLLLAAMVVAAAAVLTVRLSARRGRSGVPGGRRRVAGGENPDPDPDALERRAEEAERRGDLDAALRFRFRAGLLRLADAGVVRLRPGLTNAAVSRTLRSPSFDELARHFDEVAYGRRPATESEVAAARTTWPTVVEAARATVGASR